jgi:putative ABC transport system permease protein
VRRSVLSSLRAHLGRLVAACLAIVIGVGFATLALTARSSVSHGIDQTIGAQYDGVDAVVRSAAEALRPADLAAIRKLPQTAAADGLSHADVQTTWKGDVRLSYLSVESLSTEPSLPGPKAKEGRLPEAAGEIALPATLAAKHEVTIGSAFTLRTMEDKAWELTVVGTIDDSRSIGPAEAVATADEVKRWDRYSSYDTFRVAAKGGTTPAQLVAAINGVGEGLKVSTADDWIRLEVESFTHGIDVLGGVFGMFALIALFVACLVIANTFTILLAQRTREVALLRCVGASRRQVFSSVLTEAAVVGAAASAIGVVFGVALAAIGLAVSDRFDWGIPPVGVHTDALSLAVPLALGIAATLLAAVVPARRATKVAPLAALRPEVAPAVSSTAGRIRLAFGFLLIAGGALLLYAGASTHQVLVGVAGGLLSFLGVLAIGSLLVPALIRLLGAVPALIRLVGAVPARGGGVPARIAIGNAVRNPKRTAATTSALLIGVTLISLTCVGIGSVEKTFDRSMDAEYPLDLMVSSAGEPMPATAERQLRDIDGIDHAVPVRGVVAQAGQQEIQVSGIDPEAARTVARSTDISQLKPGTALIGPDAMKTIGIEDGDSVTLKVGASSLEVRAVMADGLDPVVLSTADLHTLAPRAAVTGFWLDANDKADGSEVIDAVEQSLPGVKDLTVTGGLAERSAYTQVFDVLLIIGVALLGVSVLIALVGVGNTLSLSVLERTRENALLRALGLTRRQLRGMLAIESLLMALVAAGLGVVLGLLYGWAGTAALMGHQVDEVAYAVPAGLLATIALVAAAAGLLASVLPARRAAKVAPADALATE